MIIKVKYHNEEMGEIKQVHEGKWYDLRASETIIIPEGEFRKIPLGVSIELPEGYEALMLSRSSTFGNYGIIQINSVRVIDHKFCGEEDIWKFPAYCLKGKQEAPDGTRFSIINEGDRICRFRIFKRERGVELVKVDHMEKKSRGGFGNSGVK